MNWEPTADGHHCKRHDSTFKRGEVCQRCVTDPGDEIDALDTAGLDAEIVALAGEFTSRARRLWRETVGLLDDGTAQDKATACKLSAESAKWERLALEAKDKVAQRKHLREAMAHERAMSGLRGHN